MQTLRSFACLVAALGSIAIAGCTASSGPDGTLTIFNDSDFTIVDIRLTRSSNSGWGPNRLAGDVLLPDEQITLPVDCDFYDAQLVDEDNVTCELQDLDLCLNDADWVIRNNTCTVFGVAKAAREAAKAAASAAAPASAATL